MPVLSRFHGLVVYMSFRQHGPPHFHACCQGDEVTVEISSGRVSGTTFKRALAMLFEGMEALRGELMDNWQMAAARKPLRPIDPLP